MHLHHALMHAGRQTGVPFGILLLFRDFFPLYFPKGGCVSKGTGKNILQLYWLWDCSDWRESRSLSELINERLHLFASLLNIVTVAFLLLQPQISIVIISSITTRDYYVPKKGIMRQLRLEGVGEFFKLHKISPTIFTTFLLLAPVVALFGAHCTGNLFTTPGTMVETTAGL